MPKGELYIRTQERIAASSDQTGVGNDGWVDTYVRYGISFTQTALSSLMTPAPNKEHVENKSTLQHGKRLIRDASRTKKDERDVSLEMHLAAPDVSTFWARYDLFCSEVLDYGFLELKNAHVPTKVFRMTYLKCSQFSEYMEQLAKFTLTLNEPDPTDRALTANT